MLLETGVVARTPIESNDSPAPIAALIGPGDAFVAMASSGRDVSVAPAIGASSTVSSMDALVSVTPDAPRADVPVPAWSSAAVAADPGMASMSALSTIAVDPTGILGQDLQAQLLLAALDAQAQGLLPAAGVATDATVQGQAIARTAGADRTTSAAKRHKRKPGPWRVSPMVTWYGPGFYGNRTACGQRYSRNIVGVAHRTLPCGTLIQFRWRGKTAVAPVIDRGPYGPPRLVFDFSAWLACRTFRPHGARNGCFTRTDVHYRVVGKVNLKDWFKHKKAQKRKHRG